MSQTIMKKLIVLALVLGCTAIAQAQIAVGGGLGLNEKINSIGLTVKGEFGITDQIAVSPSISYFFGSGTIVGFNENLFAIDVNGTYSFDIIEKLTVYPVAGLNFSRYRVGTSTVLFGLEESIGLTDNAFGVNIGAGAQWAFTDSLSVYFEPKFVASNFSQIVINAGVLFKL